MNDLEFSFEPAPWELFLRKMQAGDTVDAVSLLAVLEGESDQAAEDALQEMEMACLRLDISGLRGQTVGGEVAVRLRREQQLAQKPLDPSVLEPGDPLRLYLEEIAAMPACGEESLLAAEAARGEESTRAMLTNLGLSRVVEIAREHTGCGVLLLDLIQEGSLGLWQAVCAYRRGEYEAHRDKWIRFYMAKAILLQARACGVGQKMRTALEDYRAVDQRLLADLGRNPTLEEIAQELHMTAEEAERVKTMLENARMLQRSHQEEKEPEPTEEDEQAVENTALFQMRQRIGELLSRLPEEDARLLTLRFGLEGELPMSPEETGRRLGLTPEEVVAREGAALAQLRN